MQFCQCNFANALFDREAGLISKQIVSKKKSYDILVSKDDGQSWQVCDPGWSDLTECKEALKSLREDELDYPEGHRCLYKILESTIV